MGRSKSVWRILGDGDAVGVCVSPGGAGREPRRQRREERGSHFDWTPLRAARRGEPDDSGGLLERSEATPRRSGDPIRPHALPCCGEADVGSGVPELSASGQEAAPLFARWRPVRGAQNPTAAALWRQGQSETGRYLDLSVRYHQGDRNFSQTTACGKSDRGKRRKSERSDPVCQVTSEVSIRQQSIVLKLCQNSKFFAWNGLCLERKQIP